MKLTGVDTFYPVEDNEINTLLASFLEQIKSEKSAGAYPPVRIMYGADKRERELVNECLVEDSVDKNSDFPYSDFL